MPFDATALKADLGGKPTWVWGIVGGVVVLGGYYWYSSNKKAKTAGQLTQVVGSPLDQTSNLYPTISGSTDTITPNTGSTLGNQTLETNNTWIARGITILSNKGVNGVEANNALANYLSGVPITSKQSGYVSTVLSGIGYPPEGNVGAVKVIKDAVTPTAKTTTKNTPKAVSTVTPKAKTAPVPATPKATTPKAATPFWATWNASVTDAPKTVLMSGPTQ